MNGYIIDKFKISAATEKQASAAKLLNKPKNIFDPIFHIKPDERS